MSHPTVATTRCWLSLFYLSDILNKMKLVSWNVNGLRAIIGKGFEDIFRQMDADCFCLQETKIQPGQVDLSFDGYDSFFDYAEKKGYSGTAIFTRIKPLSEAQGIGVADHDREGRVVTLDLGPAYLVNVYTPNSQADLKRIEYRMEWEKAFADYVCELDKKKPVIICGDLNVAHKEIDLVDPKRNEGSPGYSDQERNAFGSLLQRGFVDTFRLLHPDTEGAYTWWSYWYKSRQRNLGWRIDYFLVSDRIKHLVKAAEIHPTIMGSDHCPVSIDIDL